MKMIRDYRVRQWLYGVLSALLVLLTGYGLVSAEHKENIDAVLTAVLNLGGAAGLALATAKADIVTSDFKNRGRHVAEDVEDVYGADDELM